VCDAAVECTAGRRLEHGMMGCCVRVLLYMSFTLRERENVIIKNGLKGALCA